MNALQRGMCGMRALPSLWRHGRLLSSETGGQPPLCAIHDNTGQLPQVLPWCHWRGCTLTAALRMRSTVRTRGLQRRASKAEQGLVSGVHASMMPTTALRRRATQCAPQGRLSWAGEVWDCKASNANYSRSESEQTATHMQAGTNCTKHAGRHSSRQHVS